MTALTELRTFLLGDAAIVAVVAARVYPVKLPQAPTMPAIVYARVTGQYEHNTQGPAGLSRPRVQIDCWAASLTAADALADLVRTRLDGYRGNTIKGAFAENEIDLWDEDAKLWRVSRDYFIWFGQ